MILRVTKKASANIEKSRRPVSTPEPMTSHSGVALRAADGSTRTMLRLGKVTQRNWSRVAEAVVEAPFAGMASGRVFVKQFVDSSGTAYPVQCDFEREGSELAARLIGHLVQVPALLYVDRDRLLHVYEYVDLLSIDDLLRGDPARLQRLFPPLTQALCDVLAVLGSAAGTHTADLKTKTRHFGGASTAVNFKGMDIRNVGLNAASQTEPMTLAMFDFGRPYLAPLEGARAKLYVSIGLLNWGRPVRRFLRGPDEELLAIAQSTLGDYLDRESILVEIEYQRRTRERDVKAPNRPMLLLKKLGVRTIGRHYLRQLTTWCKQNLPATPQ